MHMRMTRIAPPRPRRRRTCALVTRRNRAPLGFCARRT
ncbi:hypothetical protein GBP346_B3021 [Burkholderia pseudomallei MSHR346]|nr:hypothetical protein BURPSPAST_E0131 [Burkholderia pseudomallei Pasteur 52237]EDU10298.1 hypothetical protein BURPS1655_C0388 [Burkholderia pseudomallei 1655]EEP50657.1 hypothetical protein GBP346_B3021 [Burkholderia pseudomallei MSHR346]